MPSNLTDVSSFDTVIGPTPTDIRNAAGVRSFLQTLANRTRFLFDRLTALADIAALKAIATPADGLVRHVKGRGLYVFDASAAATETLPWIVQPTSGTGRWVHVLQAVQGQASGLATLDGSAKLLVSQLPSPLPATAIPNRLVASALSRLSASVPVPNTATWTDGVTLAVPNCQVGDILVVDAFAAVTTGGSSGVDLRLVVVEGSTNEVGQFSRVPPSMTYGNVSFHTSWTVVVAGTVTVKVQGISAVAGASMLGHATGINAPQSSMRVLHFRP